MPPGLGSLCRKFASSDRLTTEETLMQSRNLLLALGAAAIAVALELVPAQA